jgi:hypothetical protein
MILVTYKIDAHPRASRGSCDCQGAWLCWPA